MEYSKIESQLLTVKGAAHFLNIKESRVRTEIFRRRIPYVKIGALVRLRKKDLEKWIEQNIKNPFSIDCKNILI